MGHLLLYLKRYFRWWYWPFIQILNYEVSSSSSSCSSYPPLSCEPWRNPHVIMCVHPYIKDINGVLVPLPCGHCVECLKTYSRDWNFRLSQELKNAPCWFITLTYNDWNLPSIKVGETEQSCVIVSEVQRFMKRYRKWTGNHSCRYFAVGEYGGKYNRAHYHILLFTDLYKNVHEAYLDVYRAWTCNGDSLGFVYVKKGIEDHFHYLTKYVNKLDERHHFAKPFKLMSKGLGSSFLSSSMIDFYSTNPHRTVMHNGHEISLPRYYVKKLSEKFNYNGMSYGEMCTLLRYKPVRENDPRWFHQYFCDNYEEIHELFVWSELENEYTTKFLDPSINMVFDWFLDMNRITKDSIWRAREILDRIKIRERSTERGQPIGKDYLLNHNELDFT